MTAHTFHPVADVFPLMAGKEFDDLVEDVRTYGLREPIWLHQDGRIIDGRNRYRACVEAHREPRFQTYIGPDDSLMPFVVSLNLRRRHLNESQRAMVADRLAGFSHGGDRSKGQICPLSQTEAAKLLNVSTRSIKTARRVLNAGSEHITGAVDAGELAVSDAVSVVDLPAEEQDTLLARVQVGDSKNLKAARHKAEIQQQKQGIEAGTIQLPDGVFEIIAIDPPWPYDGVYDPDFRRGTCAYPSITIEDLKALKLPAADNCVLWLWTTNAFMPEACTLLDAWGFNLKTILTWVKPRLGLGRWLRNCTEHCLMATKGAPRVDLKNQTTVLEAPGREHSRKPDEFYALVEELCIGRRLDYFSREPRPGWEQFGSEPNKFEGAA